MTQSRNEVMCKELHDWATKVMYLASCDVLAASMVPNVNELKPLCRGQMNEIWKYLIAHVRTCKTAGVIRGNLKVQQMQSQLLQSTNEHNAQKSELKLRKQKLISELSSTVSSIQVLERDIERVRTDVIAADHSYQSAVSQINDMHRKVALLTAHSRLASENAGKIDEFTAQVSEKSDVLNNAQKTCSQPVVFVSRNAETSSIETRSMKDVRETCQLIDQFLNRLLQGTFDGSDAEMSRGREELLSHVDSALDDTSAAELLIALCKLADETRGCLSDKTSAIDIAKDAELLRFKYESSGPPTDTTTPPSVLQSVHQLLEKAQSTMFTKYIETERHKNSTWILQKRLDEASAAADDLLHQRYADSQSAAQLAKKISDVESQLTSSRAAVAMLQKISLDFTARVSQTTTEKQTLYAKYQKIQDFKKLSETKQNLIRVLVKQNMNTKTKLETQQSENVQYAQRTLKHRQEAVGEAEVQQFGQVLRNSALTEVNSFAQLPLCLLPATTSSTSGRCSELSIHKLGHIPHVHCRQTVGRLLKYLDIPPFIAPELLLCRITQLVSDYTDAVVEVNRLRRDNQCPDLASAFTDAAKLQSSVNQNDRELTERILPVVKQRLADATHALSDCLELKDVVVHWWEQPAQTCTPWITVDGLNLQQWRHRWTVSATRLRQSTATAAN